MATGLPKEGDHQGRPYKEPRRVEARLSQQSKNQEMLIVSCEKPVVARMGGKALARTPSHFSRKARIN
jgi:hypothetical protein